jgi:hypothetical protein
MKIALCAALLVVAAGCGNVGDEGGSPLAGKRPNMTPDASPPPTYPDLSIPGVIACFTEGAPNQTCEPGVECNFNNYNSFHDGSCTNAYSQTYGAEFCDGPEDCAAGSHCCVVGSWNGDMPLWTIACQTAPCVGGAGNYEMCHTGATAAGTCSDTARTCMTANAAGDYSIAANLYVCN